MGAALEDLGGTGVLDRVEATLEFSDAGKVAGVGSCNRFFGKVEISAGSIRFGPLGWTRMACVEAIGIQEGKYLKARQDAERFSLNGSVLLIFGKATESPLSFLRKEPYPSRAEQDGCQGVKRGEHGRGPVGRRVAAGGTSTIIRSRWPRPAVPERAEPDSVLVGLARDPHRNSS